MTTIDKITNILFIVFTIIYVLFVIIAIIIYSKALFKPKKYYRIEYIFDNDGKFQATIKARTPEQAIRKLLRNHPRYFPLNEITNIKFCKEVDFYKCLEEE